MKPIRWTPHAEQEAARRDIAVDEAEKTVSSPDSSVPGDLFRRILMRRYFDSILETEMLLRVIVEDTETEIVIVSLYKTSKFKKYEEGQRDED